MLKQAFAIGLLGTLGLASVGADASTYGYRPLPPPPAYVRPAYYPRYPYYPRPAYYPRYVYPAYSARRWCPPAAPRYSYRAPAPRYWNGRPPHHGGGNGHGDHDKGHGGGTWGRR